MPVELIPPPGFASSADELCSVCRKISECALWLVRITPALYLERGHITCAGMVQTSPHTHAHRCAMMSPFACILFETDYLYSDAHCLHFHYEVVERLPMRGRHAQSLGCTGTAVRLVNKVSFCSQPSYIKFAAVAAVLYMASLDV